MEPNFTDLLKDHFPFWEQLTIIEQQNLQQASHVITYQKGQILHSEDMDCIGVLIVLQGTLRVYMTSDEGREITLYRLDPGETCILSAACVLKSIHFDVSIESEVTTRVLQISSSTFLTLTEQNIYAELYSYKLATERFSEIMWTMQEILFKSMDKRLAAFLIDECIKEKDNTIHITHEQIAKYLGSAREVVSRMLKYFSTEGYVSLSRGGITILEKQKLKDLALSR